MSAAQEHLPPGLPIIAFDASLTPTEIRGFGLELMPPSIRDPGMLALLGDILGVEPVTSPLRLRLMDFGFCWQTLVDLAADQDMLPPLILSTSRTRIAAANSEVDGASAQASDATA